MKKFQFLIIFFSVFIISTLYSAQHTLTNDEVEVVNGVIVKCIYDFSSTEIIIPDSLKNEKITGIGKAVFQYRGIETIQLPEGIEEIGDNAFEGNAFVLLTIPATVTKIGKNAFGNNQNQISNLTIPANVKTIGSGAFSNCSISTLTLEEGVVSIGNGAFSNNFISNLTIPNSVTYLGGSAFESNQIESLTLGTGLKTISNRAFYNNFLTSLEIPYGVLKIEGEAFADNQLSSITIPESVISMYWGPFNGNAIVNVNGESSLGIIYGRNEDGSVNYSEIVSYGGTYKSINFIPETVTNIGDGAFQRNGLTSVTIPGTVNQISWGAFSENSISTLILEEGIQGIHGMAFYNNNISSLSLPSTITYLGGGFVNKNVITTFNGEPTNGIIYALDENGSGKFDSTTVISYAGSETAITPDIFPDSIKVIGDNAFCSSDLISVTLPSTIYKISNSAFDNNLITSLTLPDGTKEIHSNAFNNNKLTSIVIPSSVEVLGSGAFSNNLLTTVTLPTSLTHISSWLFNNNKLSNINIPSGVAAIDEGAFSNNQINSLTIPVNVTIIGNDAFNSNNLTSVNIPGNVEKIGNRAFENNSIDNLTLNNGLKIIGINAFSNNQLTQDDLAIPLSVSNIGKGAFENNSIDSIYLHEPDVAGFIKWIDGYGIELNTNIWVKDISNSYIADVELTLADDDVEIIDGVIQSVSYDIRANLLTIPRVLDGQVVIGIRERWDNEGNDLGGLLQGKNLKNIILPTSLLKIGSDAFGNNFLDSILLPDSIRYIGGSAFANNEGISSIILPHPDNNNFIEWLDDNNIPYSGGEEVYNLYNTYYAQYYYTLTDDDVEVEDNAIVSCSYNYNDKHIIIPDTLDGQAVKNIKMVWIDHEDGGWHEGLFQSKGLKSVQLPSTLVKTGEHTFAWNEIKQIVFPDSLKYINDYAFQSNKLSKITIPCNVIFIGNGAFQENILKEIVLPDPGFGNLAYWFNNEMQKFQGGDTVTKLQDEKYEALFKHTLTDDEVVMENDAIISCSYDFKDKYIVIPDTLDGQPVRLINQTMRDDGDGPYQVGMFQDKGIVAVELPVTIDTIGYSAFYNNNLSYIEIPDNIKYIDDYAFHTNWLDSLKMPVNISMGRAVFNNNKIAKLNGKTCDGIFYRVTDGVIDSTVIVSYGGKETVIDFISNKVTNIYKDAFRFNSITNVVIPNGVEKLQYYAFGGNPLNEISLPNSVIYIDMAFGDCNLSEFTLPTPQTSDYLFWHDLDFPPNYFNGGDIVTDFWKHYKALIRDTLTDDEVVVENGIIIESTLNPQTAYLVIPDTLDGQAVIGIGERWKDDGDGPYQFGMFQDERGKPLIRVDLPSTLESIGQYAFGWNQIDIINIPESVKIIKDGAFQNNRLSTVDIPDSVTFIGNAAFAENQFSEFILPNSQTSNFVYWYDYSDPVNKFNGGTTVTNLWQTYSALTKYTLTDDDVVVENGAIVSSSYDYRSRYIVIPETLDGQTVVRIAEYWKENQDGWYAEGIFQSMDDNYLVGVELPATLDSIGINAFGWNQISEIEIPEGVKFIDNSAFQGNRLNSVIIPNNVKYIGSGSFGENNLTQITLPTISSNDFVYWYDNNEPKNSYQGGDAVNDLWASYTALIKYTLTDDDVVVENGAIVNSSFNYQSLYIIIPEKLDGQTVIKIAEIWKENQDGWYVDGIFQSFDDRQLIGVELPSTLDSIGINAFGWNKIEQLTIPDNLKYIGSSAFSGNCLSSVKLPDSLTFLGDYAFFDNFITELTLPVNPQSDIWYDGDGNVYDGGSIITNFEISYSITNPNTKVNTYTIADTYSIYPNPVNNFLTIHCSHPDSNLILEIYDLNGKIVLRNANWTNEKINITGLNKGMYIIDIYDVSGKELFRKKFVKN